MRDRLLKWIVCPICQSELELIIKNSRKLSVSSDDFQVFETIEHIENRDEIDIDIVTGALTCKRCKIYYPIHNSIPRMFVFMTHIAQIHTEENADWIKANLNGFALSASEAPPGETTVLRNFSTEWKEYKWLGDSYWDTTPENMLRCKRYELGIPKYPLTNKIVLEVGIGIGGTADMISRSENCEIVGIDLGYAVDQAQHYFGENPRFHIVQASVFALPFRAETFDTVYSHGVIHHTYSTRTAFNNIARLPKHHGMLYVWVYSNVQENATLLRKVLMLIEHVVRPLLSRMPTLIQTACLVPTLPMYFLYQNIYRRKKVGQKYATRYGWNEALHAARDRLTPPYAHRHSYDEIMEYFRSAGYEDLEKLSDEPAPEGIPDTYRLNTGVRGFRKSILPKNS